MSLIRELTVLSFYFILLFIRDSSVVKLFANEFTSVVMNCLMLSISSDKFILIGLGGSLLGDYFCMSGWGKLLSSMDGELTGAGASSVLGCIIVHLSLLVIGVAGAGVICSMFVCTILVCIFSPLFVLNAFEHSVQLAIFI